MYNDGRGADVYLPVRLNGYRVSCLLDTGCETSIVGSKVAQNFTLQPTKQVLYAANGTAIPIIGQTTLEFTVRGWKYSVVVVVTEAIEGIILGIDWLQVNRCKWDFGSGRLRIGPQWIKLLSKPRSNLMRRIYAESDCEVPQVA
jgi:predicted aspartyl protease